MEAELAVQFTFKEVEEILQDRLNGSDADPEGKLAYGRLTVLRSDPGPEGYVFRISRRQEL